VTHESRNGTMKVRACYRVSVHACLMADEPSLPMASARVPRGINDPTPGRGEPTQLHGYCFDCHCREDYAGAVRMFTWVDSRNGLRTFISLISADKHESAVYRSSPISAYCRVSLSAKLPRFQCVDIKENCKHHMYLPENFRQFSDTFFPGRPKSTATDSEVRKTQPHPGFRALNPAIYI
jgi:hypothetical protein